MSEESPTYSPGEKTAPETELKIDTSNNQFVGICGDTISVMMPKTQMTKKEALLHAAWLVAMADENGEFNKILEAVYNT